MNPTRRDPYQIVTDKIVEALERGVIPWRRPWNLGDVSHQNLTTRRPYSGVNVLLLNAASAASGYASPYWLTLKQANALCGGIRRGERGTLVVFWKFTERPALDPNGAEVLDEDGKPIILTIPMLRTYTVFNVEQCDLPADAVPAKAERPRIPRVEAADAIWNGFEARPPLRHGGDRAYYHIGRDEIVLPPRENFHTPEGYYGTLFHEAVHSTGAAKRLNRRTLQGIVSPGDESYSQEELVAEIGSAMLLAQAGMEPEYRNTAAYLDGWLRAMRGDRRLVVVAAAQAEKAARYVLGESPQKAPATATDIVLSCEVPA